MQNKLIIYLFGFCIFLSGCMVGPSFEAPELENPEQFRYDSIAGDSTISIQWFQVLEDSTLVQLIDTALSNNKNLLMAASRIEQARAYLGYTRSDVYPSLNYSFNTKDANFNPNTGAKTDFNLYTAGASLSWEIDFWGKFRRANQAAKAELMASEFAKEWIKITLIADVAQTYYQLQDFKRRVAISERTLESRNQSLDIIYKKFAKGVSPELDYNQAQIQQARAAKSVPFYKRQVAITENKLAILLGQNPGSIECINDTSFNNEIIKIPVGLPSDLLLRRPDVQDAMQKLKAQNSRIGVAQAMRFPSISLTGLFGFASNELSALFDEDAIYQVTGGLLGPVFQFKKNKRRVEQEREKTNQLRLQYEQIVLLAFQDVENALVTVQTLQGEYEAINNQRVAAQNAAMLSNKRYNGGVTSFLEVLDSERSYFDSEIAASEVEMQKMSAFILLYKAVGGGWKIPDDLVEE